MKKIIICISSIVGFIGVIVILFFTLFALNNVSVDFKNETVMFQDELTQNEIIQAGDFPNGACVFFINKQLNVEKIEKMHPYLKVINIETVFPNNFIIHCYEREELFAVQFDEKKYYICDEEFKILRILTLETDEYLSIQTNAINVKGYENVPKNFIAGDFLSVNKEKDAVIKKFSPAFKLNNRTAVEQKALIKEIEFEMYASVIHKKYMVALNLIDFTDFFTKIVDAEDFLEYKINLYLETLSIIFDNEKQDSELLIFQTLDGGIVAHQIENSPEDE